MPDIFMETKLSYCVMNNIFRNFNAFNLLFNELLSRNIAPLAFPANLKNVSNAFFVCGLRKTEEVLVSTTEFLLAGENSRPS